MLNGFEKKLDLEIRSLSIVTSLFGVVRIISNLIEALKEYKHENKSAKIIADLSCNCQSLIKAIEWFAKNEDKKASTFLDCQIYEYKRLVREINKKFNMPASEYLSIHSIIANAMQYNPPKEILDNVVQACVAMIKGGQYFSDRY
ncbi:hypothetical protein H8693_09765 [Christensenellaceae bacterium NSJ-63]|uniref:Uncharacterized protein n=1 Tax=Guopingia tenuis TaxID=2763656 RepID=A0A926DI23_9FIRM|nr:hypothetical protein [Guopingia tenuis]MBC8539213.1 hypothetical protein [Guopingia tenuis]